MDLRLAKTLYLWAKTNPENPEQLSTWLASAIAAIAEGKGAQMANATGNGISVSLMAGSMKITDWANTLSLALSYLENPPRTKITGRVA